MARRCAIREAATAAEGIKEAIDAYFDGRPFEVTVKAACLGGRKLSEAIPVPAELPARSQIADGSVRLENSDVIDIEEISESGEPDPCRRAARRVHRRRAAAGPTVAPRYSQASVQMVSRSSSHAPVVDSQ